MNTEKITCNLDCCFNEYGKCALKNPNGETKTNDFGIEYIDCKSAVPFVFDED